MFRRFSANFALFSMALDGLMIALTLFVSAKLRVDMSTLPLVRPVEDPVQLPWLLYFVFPALWVGILVLFSVYDGRRNLRVNDEMGSLALGSLLATVSMAGILFLTFRDISRFLFIFFAVEAFMMLALWRLVLRMAWRSKVIGNIQVRQVLVLGAGTVGKRVRQQVESLPHLGLAFAGFLDDDPSKHTEEGVLGGLERVRQVVNERQVEDVVVALPRSAYAALTRVVTELHDLPVRVWVVPDYFSLALHRATVEEFAGLPMMDLRAPALSEYQRMMKRAFDLMLTLAAMPFVLPVIGAAALAIKLDDGGPLFYRPKRVGENGRYFEMIKFRTMVVNADQLRHLVEKTDEQGRMVFKHAADPRITRVGRFLRRTSLDELPQLFNILKGEMSLVGPRPEQPHLVEKYEPWQRKRFAVPQGLTGWWQVNGRSDKPMHLHTDEDLYYVQHYSIWLDLRILLKTVWVVLRGKGAY